MIGQIIMREMHPIGLAKCGISRSVVGASMGDLWYDYPHNPRILYLKTNNTHKKSEL